MKKAFIILALLVVAVCGKLSYDLIRTQQTTGQTYTEILSQNANEEISIPLRDSGEVSIRNARDVQEEGKNLFLVSDKVLYRFDKEGDYVCPITDTATIHVLGYVINPSQQQLIVLGNTNDIFYYTYNGELLFTKKLKSDLAKEKLP